MSILIDFSNSKSKYSILFDFHFLLLLLSLLSTLFSLFDELRKSNESKDDSTFVHKTTTMIWANSNYWASKKSKLNELKIISSWEISFVIVEFLIKINDFSITIKIDESIKIVEFSIKIVEFSIKIDEFSINVDFFEIEIKWKITIWNVLTNFLKRVLFIVHSSNQIRVSSKSTNELRVRRLIDSIVKTRKY